MISSILGVSPYARTYPYEQYQVRNENLTPVEQAQQTRQAQDTGKVRNVVTTSKAASPDTPIQPVQPVPSVDVEASGDAGQLIPFLRQGADPAELAVRMRMTQYDPAQNAKNAAQEMKTGALPNPANEGECKTCAERKYQDGSDDPGVSFKTAAHIAPEQAAAKVRGHEMEHVTREQAKAEREDREVVSQHVNIHTAICPECGKVYVSGGTTTTTTAAKSQLDDESNVPLQKRKPFFAVA